MGNKSSTNSNPIQEHALSAPTQGPIKPLFSHSIKWRCANPEDFAYINKLRPKLLSNLNFSNNEAQNLDIKVTRSLCRVLTDAKRSSTLHIEDSRLNSKQLHHILNSTNHLKKVKIHSADSEFDSSNLSNSLTRIGRNKALLELTVCYLNSHQGDETYYIRKQLKQLRKLEYLSLDLPFCKSEIILSFQSFRSLKSFKIPFRPNSFIKQSILPHLLSNLLQCNQLEELTLDFQHYNSIDHQEAQLWNSFFQKTQNLKSLTLLRSFNARQDFSGFQVFPECFKFMKHLTTLRVYLDIYVYHLDHDQVFFIDFFFDRLKSLPQLKKLEFTIDGSHIVKDVHIKNLPSALGRLKNLHSLDLDIHRLECSSEIVISLAKYLKNLSCLKHFKLNFAGYKYSSLTYRAVKAFAKNLTRLPLKSLNLALSDQPIFLYSVIDKQKVPLLSALSSLKDLSSLHIDLLPSPSEEREGFYLNPKILRKLTSFSVVVDQSNFAEKFKGLSKFMPNLTTLKLEFPGGVVCGHEVALSMRNLDACPNLYRLELTFRNADYFIEKTLDSLQAALVKLTKLEYLGVNLWTNENNIVNKFRYGLIVPKRLKLLVANFERPPSLF